MQSPKQDLVHCPITALAFYTSADKQLFILAGEDAWLKVYSTQDRRLCGQLRIFEEQPIHGISVSSTGDLLVWGGPAVSIVPRKSVELLSSSEDAPRPYEALACDWIQDGLISPYDSTRGVVVTSNNEIVPFTVVSVEVEKGQPLQPKPVWGGLLFLSRQMLYSATVQWAGPDEVLVVAGTVFGEIVVWKCSLGREVHAMEALLVLKGHEGSIFGVAISPEVELVPGRKQRLLASCSDDRTIRIWDITQEFEKKVDEEPREHEAVVRETGFGGNNDPEAQSTTSEPDLANRCLAVATGHASRIWKVRFACDKGATAGQIEVFSFGEDTTMQKWRLASDKNTSSVPPKAGVASGKAYPYILEHMEKTPCHSGKNIWSCAVTSDGPGRIFTVTGGADGKITLVTGESNAVTVKNTEPRGQSRVLSLDDVVLSLGPQREGSGDDGGLESLPPKSKKDGFLRYAFLSQDKLLVSTISGRLLLGDLQADPSWSEIAVNTETQHHLEGYNVVRKVAPGTAIVGSTSGRLYIFREPQGLEEIAQLPGKITDVLCIPDPQDDDWRAKLRALVTVLGSTEATIFTLDVRGSTVTVRRSSSLPLHIGFVVTAVGVCGDLLLLGSRKGVITVYEEIAGIYVHRIFRNDCTTKGGDAVTSIITLPPLKGTLPKYVLTTCRDGKYRIYEIESSNTGFLLRLLHETSPPLGPMLEGAALVRPLRGDIGVVKGRLWEGGLELIIFGFRSTNFVVWNETRQEEIASVACGGAHRTFDYYGDGTDPNKVRFVYTKASAMGIYSQNEPWLQVVRPGGHGREIRAVASDGEWSRLVATGAEDTCIRIWQCIKNVLGAVIDMRCLAVLQKHTAGLQALKWERNGYLLSSAGAEEFFVWRITFLQSEYTGLAVTCEAVYPFKTPDGDLRITDFDSWTTSTDETHTEAGILVTMVFSNSVLKTYQYLQSTGFVCLQSGRYTGACLTQVKQLMLLPEQTARMRPFDVHVITGATDGTVAVWRPTAPWGREGFENGYQIVSTSRPHANSVKSLEVLGPCCAPHGHVGYNVFTDGDDNALALHFLSARVGETGILQFQDYPVYRKKDAHAAAITGVKVWRRDNGSVYLATVSNDQRLKLWEVKGPSMTEPLRIALLFNAYSALADPGGLDVIDGGNLMVAGVGMEIWDFQRGQKLQLL